MKITEALCNVITEAGGTPTTADSDSVTHALGTLYTTLGGTDTLPDDVADRINSLSDHIGGGGGSAPKMGKVTIVNNTGVMFSTFWYVIGSDGSIVAAAKPISAGETVESPAPMYRSRPLGDPNEYTAYYLAEARIPNSVSPGSLVTTSTIGSASLIRHTAYDNSTNYGYILLVRSTVSTVTESPVVTISVNA